MQTLHLANNAAGTKLLMDQKVFCYELDEHPSIEYQKNYGDGYQGFDTLRIVTSHLFILVGGFNSSEKYESQLG